MLMYYYVSLLARFISKLKGRHINNKTNGCGVKVVLSSFTAMIVNDKFICRVKGC